MTRKRLGRAVDNVCTKNLNKAYNGRRAFVEGGCEVFFSTANLKFAEGKYSTFMEANLIQPHPNRRRSGRGIGH